MSGGTPGHAEKAGKVTGREVARGRDGGGLDGGTGVAQAWLSGEWVD